MRSRLLLAAGATLLLNVVVPAHAQPAPLDRARVLSLVKQVWAAGTWDQQRAAFERLPSAERAAVWDALVHVTPGPVRYEGTAPALRRGPCHDQNIDECDYAVAPKPSPTAKPRTNPNKPPVVTPPAQQCTSERAFRPFNVLDQPGVEAFVYASQLNWCYWTPAGAGPLSDYSSNSWASNCCKFPWTTDPSKYIDKLVPLPASGTQHIQDHHTGYFEAKVDAGPVSAGETNTPNIDATVLADGSYVCS